MRHAFSCLMYYRKQSAACLTIVALQIFQTASTILYIYFCCFIHNCNASCACEGWCCCCCWTVIYLACARVRKTLSCLCKLSFTLQAAARANPLPSSITRCHGNLFDMLLNSNRPGGGLFTVWRQRFLRQRPKIFNMSIKHRSTLLNSTCWARCATLLHDVEWC